MHKEKKFVAILDCVPLVWLINHRHPFTARYEILIILSVVAVDFLMIFVVVGNYS